MCDIVLHFIDGRYALGFRIAQANLLVKNFSVSLDSYVDVLVDCSA
jgi:hypothetical protein